MAIKPQQEISRRTRRSFAVMGAGAVALGAGAWFLRERDEDDPVPAALRGVLGINEGVTRRVLFGDSHLAKTYPASMIGNIKVNGEIGLDPDENLSEWRLNVKPSGAKLDLADVTKLPRYEQTIDFKCVEGWSTVTQFAGARLSDFTAKFAPGGEKAQCVGMKTPDEEYYVSLDMASALHPQTLLAWEMNGRPLTPAHGAPLRLVIPVKYGIKNIKRIGTIEYTDSRPDDYWAERGYDWYAGL